jgi:hypothetical protein
MSLKKIKIFDGNFSHAKYSSDFQISKYIEWDRSANLDPNEIVFITDNYCVHAEQIIGRKLAWLMEPRAINSSIYEWMKNNYNLFQNVLTYDKVLLDNIPNGIFVPHGMCWIKPEDQKIYNKTKLYSIISSSKTITEGHKLRHRVIKKFNDLDVYGRGYYPIESKLEALKDYAFTIVIENSKSNTYFTEKINDAFATGTVPIYWGTSDITSIFNPNGMIIFDDINSLQNIIKTLSLEKYNSMLPAIKENFELSKKFHLTEDWIFENTNLMK